MINLVLINGWEGMPPDVEKQLRAQGVCMDDWDFMLIFDDELLETSEDVTRPSVYAIERMGLHVNEMLWRKVTLDGYKVALGVAYH